MSQSLLASRRNFLAWAGSSAALMLAGCGSGSVADPLNPQRFLIVGDGFCDQGQGQNGTLPTVNDGSLTWLQQMATYYGSMGTIKPANQGGTAWAQAYAFIASTDTVSGTNAPSVQTQISKMLAATTIGNSDLVFINGGMADIVQAVTQTGISAATTTAVQTAANALATQVRRLTQNGGTHVVVIGVYDISISPWAAGTGLNGTGGNNTGPISDLTVSFNDQLLTAINDLGSTVLYLDAALFYNLVYNSPSNYSINNTTAPVCSTPNALTCSTNTLISAATTNSSDSNYYDDFLFADDLHFAPAAQRLFGLNNYSSNGYQRLSSRW